MYEILAALIVVAGVGVLILLWSAIEEIYADYLDNKDKT